MKKSTLWIILLLGLWGMIELLSSLGLVILDRFKSVSYQPFSATFLNPRQEDILRQLLTDQSTYLIHHPVLGWSIRPNGRNHESTANAAGIRAGHEYTPEPLAGITRISTFGDSFTHGDEVQNQDTWQAAMERLNPQMEVLNFGVPGYGLDQAYLRYNIDGVPFRSNIVFIGYMIDNIERTVNTYRPFYAEDSEIPLTKPRFILKDGQLTLIDNPLPRLEDYRNLIDRDPAVFKKISRYDFYYNKKYFRGPFDLLPSVRLFKVGRRQYKEFINERMKREAFRINEEIFRKFHDLVRQEGGRPIIIIFPTQWDIYRQRDHQPIRYQNILTMMQENHFEYIDLLHAFESESNEYPLEALFQPNKHYSPLANQIIAAYMLRYLADHPSPATSL